MFAASRFYKYNREWTLRGRIMKSGDGYRKFHHAVKSGEINQFLLKCLLFTVLEPQNHMRCFKGSNGKFYTNQLCLDASNGETIAIRDLKLLNKNEKENELLSIWDTILKFVKQTSSYNPRMTYGVHQIEKEINTFHRDENNKRHPDHPELNGALKSLNEHLKCYYITEILPVLYRYKFLM